MRSTASLGRLAVSICAVSLAVAAADDGGSIAQDIGEGAGAAAGNVASGVRSAGQGIADAGAAAAGAVSGAATTAAEAAREAAAGASSGASSAMDGGAAGRLSDAQIAAVAAAANKVEIDAAIRDHTAADKQAAALVKRLGLTPEENETSRSLTQRAGDDLANLQPLKGKDFEKAYAEHELAFHRQVLATFDEKLISDAQNADLKSLLESVRSVVAEHRDHAQALVDSLSK